MTTMAEHPITEFVDLDIDRVDGVDTPANGTGFLLLKGLAPASSVTGNDVGATLDAVTDPSSLPEDDDAATKAFDDVADEMGEGVADEVEDDGPAMVELAEGQVIVPVDVEPGSPEWEAADAEALSNVAAVLARMAKAIEAAKDREWQEVDAGNEAGSYDHVWSLDDASCALDFALGIIARLAVYEAAEAEGDDVAKAGRVLSAANEASIRSAVDTLSGVLAVLAKDDPEEDKTDGEDAEDPEEDAVEKSRIEAIVDERIAAALSVAKAEGDEAPAEAVEAEGDAPVDEVVEVEASAPVDDDTPADAAAPEVEDGVDKAVAPEAPADGEAMKAVIADAIAEALAPVMERVEKMAAAPAPGGVFLATEGRTELPTTLADVNKALAQETDPQKRAILAQQIAQSTLAEQYRK